MNVLSELERNTRVFSVTELNRLAKETIESALPLMWVAGEISNFVRAASGHSYFSLKDGQAQVRCVMFRHKGQLHDWTPANGMQVEVRALPSFYEARGEFQLNVDNMRRAGLGALYAAFEKLKARLQAEGLFNPASKLAPPAFPRAIGIVTSPQAAALRDVLTTLRRRMPAIPVVLYPTPVQGEDAGRQIAAAIATADARDECDVLIVCRGGGSIEDLWAFNEEAVARAIHACRLPVISGVGHETDFTIADFVADARAPTPTAAAQMASPDRDELRRETRRLNERLARATRHALENRMQQLDLMARRLVHPGERIARQRVELAHFARRMQGAWTLEMTLRRSDVREIARRTAAARPDVAALILEQQSWARRLTTAADHRLTALGKEIKSIAAQLSQLNPRAVLERGYALAETAQGAVVRDSAQLAADQNIKLTFAKGWARARVGETGE